MKEYKLRQDSKPHHGNIELYLTGFSLQKIISIKQIVAAVDILPNSHLEGLKELVFDPDRNYLDDVDFTQWQTISKAKGSFRKSKRHIMIYDFDSLEFFHKILFHEIGHYVFYCIIDSVTKKRWVTELYPKSHYISKYARRNGSEDFAESYAAYVLEPLNLMKITAKYQFMRQTIFHNFKPQILDY